MLEVTSVVTETSAYPVLAKVLYYLNKNWKQVLLSKWEIDNLELGAKVDIRLHNCPGTMIALKNLKAAYIGILLFLLLVCQA